MGQGAGGALALALVAGIAASRAEDTGGRPAGKNHVRASFVAETDGVRPGASLVVGFHLLMNPEWHVYWRNPGDAGLATRARLELPAGLSASELGWPRPTRFETRPLVSYGYEHEVLHPVEIDVTSSGRLIAGVQRPRRGPGLARWPFTGECWDTPATRPPTSNSTPILLA